MKRIFVLMLVLTIALSGCSTSNNEEYYSGEGNITANAMVLEQDLEDITQDEMTGIYKDNYGWTDLVSHELYSDGETVLIKFYFEEDAKRWQIDAARAYTYKEMKYVYINNYELTPYQYWRMSFGNELEMRVCAEVYVSDNLLVQDMYEDEIPIKYENTAIIVDSRNIESEWTKGFDSYIEQQKGIDEVKYQNSLLGKAIIIQIHSDKMLNPDIKDELRDYIKDEIADNATRDNEQDVDNNGKYQYLVLELYKSGEKYYEDVFINQEELEWKQFDWMNN